MPVPVVINSPPYNPNTPEATPVPEQQQWTERQVRLMISGGELVEFTSTIQDPGMAFAWGTYLRMIVSNERLLAQIKDLTLAQEHLAEASKLLEFSTNDKTGLRKTLAELADQKAATFDFLQRRGLNDLLRQFKAPPPPPKQETQPPPGYKIVEGPVGSRRIEPIAPIPKAAPSTPPKPVEKKPTPAQKRLAEIQAILAPETKTPEAKRPKHPLPAKPKPASTRVSPIRPPSRPKNPSPPSSYATPCAIPQTPVMPAPAQMPSAFVPPPVTPIPVPPPNNVMSAAQFFTLLTDSLTQNPAYTTILARNDNDPNPPIMPLHTHELGPAVLPSAAFREYRNPQPIVPSASNTSRGSSSSSNHSAQHRQRCMLCQTGPGHPIKFCASYTCRYCRRRAPGHYKSACPSHPRRRNDGRYDFTSEHDDNECYDRDLYGDGES